MSAPLFSTITTDHWHIAIARGRRERNLVSEQISRRISMHHESQEFLPCDKVSECCQAIVATPQIICWECGKRCEVVDAVPETDIAPVAP